MSFRSLGFFTIVGVLLLGIGQIVLAGPLYGKAIDTIAGYETTLSTEYAKPHEEVVFYIEDPSGTRREFSAKSDGDGYAEVTVSGEFTHIAGEYSATAVRDGQSYEDGPLFSFTVFPDGISQSASTVSASKTSVPLNTAGNVTVRLVDKYKNPVSGKFITLIPGRSSDKVSPATVQTNKRGEAVFQVSSAKEGSASFSAMEKTSGVVLQNRATLFFFASTTSSSSGISSYLSASLTGSSSKKSQTGSFGEASTFEIDFPDTVEVKSDENYLTIRAKDDEGNTVRDYTKTILIRTPNDPKSTLPGAGGKYTFATEDQGEFTFPLALMFSKTGEQVIEVYEYDTKKEEINTAIKGEKTISVVTQSGEPTPTGASSLRITSPQQNSKFGSPEVAIIGTGNENTDLKIFVDDEFTQEIAVNAKGEFKGVLQNLSDGKHTVYVMQKEGSREVSPEVSFSVDSASPNIENFTIYPNEAVEAGSQVSFSLVSEPDLDIVTITLNGEDDFLKESKTEEGKYELTTTAPETPGTYEITITLTDRSGNTVEEKMTKKLQVKTKTSEGPSSPQNFKATGIPSGVELSWDPMTEANPKVVMYIIHSGKTEDSLTRSKSVSGETSHVSITPLPAGEKLFFALSAIDEKGKEGPKTVTLSVTPGEGGDPSPSPTDSEDPLHSSAPAKYEVKATPGPNSVILSWNAFTDEGIQGYEVKYGVEPGTYRATRKITVGATDLVIEDLISGKPYYFSVSPIATSGKSIANIYSEVSATPAGPTGGNDTPQKSPLQAIITYPSRVTDTGPEFFLFIGALFFCGGIVFSFMRKER